MRFLYPLLFAGLLPTILPLQAATAHLDCGGQGGSFGVPYDADRLYTSENGSGAIDGTAQTLVLADNGQVIENTPYPLLFNSTREGVSEYRFDVPNGLYQLTLEFSELTENGPNLRKFSVLAEGKALLTDLDLYALYGRNYAVTYRFAVLVKDGQLNVTFPASIGVSTISGIAVDAVTKDSVPPGAPTHVTGLGGYYRSIISWPDVTVPDLSGYLVFKASSAGGPFLPLNTLPTPVSRYFDDAVTPGATSFYAVKAVDVFGNISGPSLVAAATPLDRTASTLPVYQLTLAADQYAILQSDPNSDYVDADFTGDGILYADIGVKYRGTSSLLDEKKSWKVNFKKGNPFEGRDKVNQKASALDTTLLTECLSSAQIEETSSLVGTCSFSHLEVNGEFLGVFSHIEEVDDDFFNARGLNPAGKLFEADDPATANFQILPDYSVAWEDQSDDETGFDTLSQLIQTINNTPAAQFPSTISSILNVDSYLDYYASIMLTGDWDHVGHNYYVYLSPDSPVWELIPKDFDQAFSSAQLPVNFGTIRQPLSGIYNILTQRILSVPQFRQWYVNKMRALLGNEFTPTVMNPRIEGFHGQIEDDAHRDVYKRYREVNTAFDQSTSSLENFVTQRIAYVGPALNSYDPGLTQPIVINEVLANNVNGITDGAGNHSPWLELYNPGTAAFSLQGYFLTNDPSQPAMWQFPATTVVPAGGYLLVWLDNQPASGELHASFTINHLGQAVALYGPAASGSSLLDVIAYRAQSPDVSYGRMSSGYPLWSNQSSPTPGGPNSGKQ